MTWPNRNAIDACCRCGVIEPTPFHSTELAKGKPDEFASVPEGVLSRWQPDVVQVAQWICGPCRETLEA